jgi:hypothetical protein
VATEAASAPAARFLPLPFSDLGQLAQPLNKGCMHNFVAVTSPNLNVTLGDSVALRMRARRHFFFWQMALRMRVAREGFKDLATRVARAARAGPRAAAQKVASSAVYTCSLPRKAALRSGAAMAAMMTALVSRGGVSRAFLAILEPERQAWEDSRAS